jgi:hypothetical protein
MLRIAVAIDGLQNGFLGLLACYACNPYFFAVKKKSLNRVRMSEHLGSLGDSFLTDFQRRGTPCQRGVPCQVQDFQYFQYLHTFGVPDSPLFSNICPKSLGQKGV